MKLFKLTPIGLGTEQVESFSSYLARLAAVHGVSLSLLFKSIHEANRKSSEPCDPNATTSAMPWKTAALVRPTKNTKDIVQLVSHFTGCTDIRGTTFLALEELNYRSVDLFSNAVRWCPCCLQDDIDKGMPAYYRLLWSCKEVDYCHIHNLRLQKKCPSCKSKQNGTARRFDLASCKRCRKSLIHNPEPMESDSLSRDVCFRDLISLVCAVSSEPDLKYQPMASVKLLESIFDKVWSLNDEMEFWKLLPKDESLRMVLMKKPITVKKLRRVAYRLGISFPGLLAGEADCWTAQLNPNWLADLPINMRPPKRRELVDRDELLRRLTEVRNSIDPKSPPPLAFVAKVVGISTGGLEYLHPKICEEVKTQYQNWLVDERDRKEHEARAEVCEYLQSEIVNKSRKNALKTIRARTDLPKNVLLEVISQEFSRVRHL